MKNRLDTHLTIIPSSDSDCEEIDHDQKINVKKAHKEVDAIDYADVFFPSHRKRGHVCTSQRDKACHHKQKFGEKKLSMNSVIIEFQTYQVTSHGEKTLINGCKYVECIKNIADFYCR